jgi:hypothetical protein
VGQSPKTFLFAKTFRAHGTNFFRQEKSFLVLAVRGPPAAAGSRRPASG